MFLTGVGHLLSDRKYQNKHTKPSNVHSHTSFPPFLFAVLTIHVHTLQLGAQRRSQLSISLYYFKWLGTLPISEFSLSLVAVELHQDVCLLWA